MEDDKIVEAREEEEEEVKIEKFFSLIRSYREARNRLMRKESIEKKNKRVKMMTKEEEESNRNSWVPSFESEDFTEEVGFRSEPPNPCAKLELQVAPDNKVVLVKEDNGLDLNLTL
ncbi:hypothetical protein UlMin_030814 [Ulmus minor]